MLVPPLLTAGVDTVVHGISGSADATAADPSQGDQLRGEPQLARFASDEALRREPPFTLFRTTSREVAGR